MTRLWNDATRFRDEMVTGFLAAHRGQVTRVEGGVVRATRDAEPTVAVVVGGGSGHYPAFAGLVGPGLAHAAVMGNIFASPSAHQVATVAAAADDGRGVLLCYGNYAGDVLNFDQAQTQLRARGIDVRSVAVTDDICSAPVGQEELRRGIAGDLAVFKVAGAAAAQSGSLDEVERAARRANSRTRSIGVAFGGCTLPGADAPLFEVPEGMMAIGLGIHGEPGLDEVPIPSAAGLAQLFIERLLKEVPDGGRPEGARVAALLNGLGGIGDEELYVVYGRVDELLRERGVIVVDAQVGQICTSFDMPGASLTLLWMDDDLERLWLAPATTPAFRTGAPAATRARELPLTTVDATAVAADDGSDPRDVLVALEAIRKVVDEHADELGRLDAIAGDGDHGIGMSRGANAATDVARSAAAEGAGASGALHAAAEAWSNAAGGTSGALWSLMLHRVADVIAAGGAQADDVAWAVAAARDAVMSTGGAEPGDKTMVDALHPFAETLGAEIQSGAPARQAWRRAVRAADESARATSDLVPRRGRSRAHGDRAVGTADPGAISFALIVAAVGTAFDTSDPEAGAEGAGA